MMREMALPLTPKQVEIADAALRIIGNQGISALTTTALAAELGVSPGAPFRHFANRGEILEAVALRVEGVILATFPEPAGSPLERIANLFRARAGAVGRHFGIARLMFSEQFTLALPATAAKRIKNLMATTRSFLLDSLEEAARAGELRADFTPEAVLPIVLGTLQFLVFSRSMGAAKDPAAGDPGATLIALLAAPEG